mmetsp:Transcript_27945/g.57243  ORF Transcript_27945/g.57243 Transcript_27945/m.57243 type:complete len:225 (+) Transcript_27945:88-762(+)
MQARPAVLALDLDKVRAPHRHHRLCKVEVPRVCCKVEACPAVLVLQLGEPGATDGKHSGGELGVSLGRCHVQARLAFVVRDPDELLSPHRHDGTRDLLLPLFRCKVKASSPLFRSCLEACCLEQHHPFRVPLPGRAEHVRCCQVSRLVLFLGSLLCADASLLVDSRGEIVDVGSRYSARGELDGELAGGRAGHLRRDEGHHHLHVGPPAIELSGDVPHSPACGG